MEAQKAVYQDTQSESKQSQGEQPNITKLLKLNKSISITSVELQKAATIFNHPVDKDRSRMTTELV